MTVYVSIGNSDDGLSQKQWAQYWRSVYELVLSFATEVHGAWLSSASSEHQNACWCFELEEDAAPIVRERLAMFAGRFAQDSIAWAVADKIDFIKAKM